MPIFVEVYLDLPLNQTFTYAVPEALKDEVEVGKRVAIPFGRRDTTGYIVACPQTFSADYQLKEIKRVVDKVSLFGQVSIELALWMSRFYLCGTGEALGMMIPGGRRDSSAPALEIEDDLTISKVELLSDEQQTAIDTILRAEKRMYYLYGVTGSGKSEVFLRCAESMIAEGKQVIYLVPEITLTHQLSRQVANRFPGKVAILHSALTPSQRLREWKKIRSGEVMMAIGARSAVFAPFDRLGMIILDEEHEGSYKGGNTPRYHARQVAQRRCQTEDALLVMGSATPSLEAWNLMKEAKDLIPLTLTKRVGGGSLPRLEVVDLKSEQRTLSNRLEGEMRRVLANKKQVILFLNRRGFSYYFHCKSCGYELKCPHCSVSLTYHKHTHGMVCHYCGYHTSTIKVCPECKSLDVGYSGFGTEMVEQEVRSLFPTAKVQRLDTDSAKEKGYVSNTLEQFRKGEIDILLGTQMVAKGLNFPKVELVGIVLADSGMNIPDFRSQERTFSLLMQVGGRAGRYNDRGSVIIQTYHPENPAVQYALNSDVEGFYNLELQVRKETGFPPFSRLVNLVLRGRNQEKVAKQAEVLEELFRAAAPPNRGPELLCSNECPLEKIASNYRYHLLVSGKESTKVHHLVSTVLASYTPPSGVYLEVDIDPLQLL